MKKIIPNSDALKIIEESVNAGNSVHLRVRGNSMSPRLLDGKDTVILHPFIPDNLKKGDVILFHYRETFLLHRIIEIQDGNSSETRVITKGDALDQREEILLSHVVALAELPKTGQLELIVRRAKIFLKRINNYFKKHL